MTYLGDGERGLALAEESLAIAHERVPPAISIARVSEALALISLGRQKEAHAPLEAVDLMMLPEPDRTFLRVASSAARARLALLDGDVGEAETVARTVVQELRTSGVEILVAGTLVTLARALGTADRVEEAGGGWRRDRACGAAGGAPGVWEALALSAIVRARRGAEHDAHELRDRAHGIVEESTSRSSRHRTSGTGSSRATTWPPSWLARADGDQESRRARRAPTGSEPVGARRVARRVGGPPVSDLRRGGSQANHGQAFADLAAVRAARILPGPPRRRSRP